MQKEINNKTIVMYQAFKIPEAFNQVVFSILTLLYHLEGDFSKIHPVIYTDNVSKLEKYFPSNLVTIIQVQPQTLVEFAGPHKYFHRIRHFLIQDCFKQFKSNILYVDGDTFFLKSPESLVLQISENTSIMHTCEFTLEEGGDFEGVNWLKIRKLVRENTFKISNKELKIPYSTVMWNAGVLGIDYKNRDSISDTINLIDAFLRVSNIFNIEQLAIGYNLQQITEIKPAEDFIFHYWPEDLKIAYNHLIKDFLEKNELLNLTQLAARAFEVSQIKAELPRIQPNLLDKIKLRLSLIKTVALKGSL
ncbi:hypothetical protein [Adhaeribacter aquaticus]|uniref:hypothetical protein n=1 Tax=Adhaeribacter aquaticus TaxID=299567 RepID=UPI00041C0F10|nr:hypothetical protein [Adhaeribacter aquaticus]